MAGRNPFEGITFASDYAARASKEDIEALQKLSAGLVAIGASLVILHDEFMVQAPQDKTEEAMTLVTAYTDYKMKQSLMKMHKAGLPLNGFPEPSLLQRWKKKLT